MCCNGNNRRTWRFDNLEQTTASNVIREIVGFDGTIKMDFSNAIYNDSIDSAGIVSISPSGITLFTTTVDNRQQVVEMDVIAVSTGTYTFLIQASTLGEDLITRRGILVIESLTGT